LAQIGRISKQPVIGHSKSGVIFRLISQNSVALTLVSSSFGSLGRNEFTVGSDLDWTLLIDGIADPAHFDVALVIKIKERLEKLGHKPPGRKRSSAVWLSVMS
jgi:hypothetical protein